MLNFRLSSCANSRSDGNDVKKRLLFARWKKVCRRQSVAKSFKSQRHKMVGMNGGRR